MCGVPLQAALFVADKTLLGRSTWTSSSHTIYGLYFLVVSKHSTENGITPELNVCGDCRLSRKKAYSNHGNKYIHVFDTTARSCWCILQLTSGLIVTAPSFFYRSTEKRSIVAVLAPQRLRSIERRGYNITNHYVLVVQPVRASNGYPPLV